jgi:DME family drug/metabolite transporter
VSTSTYSTVGRRGSGVSLLVLAGVAWGTGGLLGSLLGRETGLTPLAVAAYRLGLGGLLVLAAVAGLTVVTAWGTSEPGARRLLGGPGQSRAALGRIGLLAVLAAAFQACYFTAVSATTVGLATLVTIGTAPVVVVVVETLRGRARRGSLPVVVLALLGLGLLVGLPTTGADPLAGAAAAVVAGSGFAVMTLVGSRPVPGLDPMIATGSSFVVGGLLLAVPAALLGRMTFPVTFSGVGLLALFAVLPTALAYTAYFRGLGAATSPGTGAVLALLEPLTAAALAAVVLGERLGVTGTVGALLLSVAVLLAARADRH